MRTSFGHLRAGGFPRIEFVGSPLSEKNPYRDLRDPALKRPCRGAALESDSLTTSSSSRLFFPTRRLCYRRGARFRAANLGARYKYYNLLRQGIEAYRDPGGFPGAVRCTP